MCIVEINYELIECPNSTEIRHGAKIQLPYCWFQQASYYTASKRTHKDADMQSHTVELCRMHRIETTRELILLSKSAEKQICLVMLGVSVLPDQNSKCLFTMQHYFKHSPFLLVKRCDKNLFTCCRRRKKWTASHSQSDKKEFHKIFVWFIALLFVFCAAVQPTINGNNNWKWCSTTMRHWQRSFSVHCNAIFNTLYTYLEVMCGNAASASQKDMETKMEIVRCWHLLSQFNVQFDSDIKKPFTFTRIIQAEWGARTVRYCSIFFKSPVCCFKY